MIDGEILIFSSLLSKFLWFIVLKVLFVLSKILVLVFLLLIMFKIILVVCINEVFVECNFLLLFCWVEKFLFDIR